MPDLKFTATIEGANAKVDKDKDGTRMPYTEVKLRAAISPEDAAQLYQMVETGAVKVTLSEVQGRLG